MVVSTPRDKRKASPELIAILAPALTTRRNKLHPLTAALCLARITRSVNWLHYILMDFSIADSNITGPSWWLSEFF